MSSNGSFDMYYKQLEGFTISKYIGITKENAIEGFPQFLTSRVACHFMVEVSRDPEGNGVGFLFLSEIEK